jgi:hypothetical protein
MFMSEEVRRLVPSDILGSFSAYFTGSIVIAVFAFLGWMLLKAERGSVGRDVAT